MQVLQELAILQQLHHVNIVNYLLVADQGSKISIMMDWAGYNLREYAALNQQQQYAESLVQHVAYQLTQTLAYLHSKVSELVTQLWMVQSNTALETIAKVYRAGFNFTVSHAVQHKAAARPPY